MISKIGKLLSVLILGLFWSVTPSRATPLNLVLNLSPDIFSDEIDVTYNPGTEQLTALGTAELFQGGPLIPNGGFSLTASINHITGALQPGGVLSITENMGAVTLLTGSLVAFGFNNGGGDPLEFLFSVTGGTLSASYGSTGGVKLNLGQGFNGSFAAPFANGGIGLGNSDTAPVGIPENGGTGFLLAASLALLGLMRKAKLQFADYRE